MGSKKLNVDDPENPGSGVPKSEGRRVERIPLGLIHAGNRLREVDEDWAEVIRASIMASRTAGQSGLINAIEVRPAKGGGFHLVAGAHRLRAIEMIGDDAIDAMVLKLDDLAARIREIDENLMRHELSPFDRGAFLAERKVVWEARYPETARGKAGAVSRWVEPQGIEKPGENATDIVSVAFAEHAAAAIGFTSRHIYRLIEIWTRLSPASRGRVRGTWIAKHGAQLRALSRLGPQLQAKVLDAMLREDAPAKRVAAAVAEVEGHRAPNQDPAEKLFVAMVSQWNRAPAKVRKRFLAQLWEQGALDKFIDQRKGDEA